MEVEIHPTAVVHSGAVIGAGSSVGPYCVIGAKVRIGCGNKICSHVVLEGNTSLGDENVIFQFASIGARPQDLKYHGEESTLEIGSKNIIREYVTLQPGTEGGGMRTRIGSQNLFMVTSHIGHDCTIGDRNVVANGVAMAGHVTIGNGVILGGLCALHQFVRIGDFALIAGGAMVVSDVPPFCMAQGDRARLVGINQVGLKRNGFSHQDLSRIKKLYRQLFCGEGLFKERLGVCKAEYGDFPPAHVFLDFIDSSARGISPTFRTGERRRASRGA